MEEIVAGRYTYMQFAGARAGCGVSMAAKGTLGVVVDVHGERCSLAFSASQVGIVFCHLFQSSGGPRQMPYFKGAFIA